MKDASYRRIPLHQNDIASRQPNEMRRVTRRLLDSIVLAALAKYVAVIRPHLPKPWHQSMKEIRCLSNLE